MIHPEELRLQNEVERENIIWWELDKIAVQNSEYAPVSTARERKEKADAATNMMRYLHKPTYEWCDRKYESERT